MKRLCTPHFVETAAAAAVYALAVTSSVCVSAPLANLARLKGTLLATDSNEGAHSFAGLADGSRWSNGKPETSWASEDADREHWVDFRWSTAQTVAAVKAYWCEGRFRTTSRQFRVETLADNEWVIQAEVKQNEQPLCNLVQFPAVVTNGLRLVQPRGGGCADRPNVLWVSEVEIYGPGNGAGIVLEDDFESGETGKPPAGWEISRASSDTKYFRAANRDAEDGGKCLETRGEKWPNMGATRSFAPCLSGVFEFDLNYSGSGRVMAYLLDGAGRTGPYVTVEIGGEMRYRDAVRPQSYKNRIFLKEDRWYHVRVLWDVGVKGYDVWLDEKLVQRGVPFMDETITQPMQTVRFLNNTAGETRYRVDNVKIQRVPLAMPAPPHFKTRITELADLCLMTTLVKDGAPQCVIVIPDQPFFRKLAEQVQAKVRACAGVSLPVQIDTESVATLSSSNAIAIGCLPNNKLIEKLYLDWFSICDRWYPGAGGWLIRTIHNPYGTGKNVILLGASDDNVLASAVTAFCARVKPGKLCQVGRIWDIHLGKDMALKPDVDSAGLSHPFNDKEVWLGSTKVFQQGLRYWYTGDEEYAKRFIENVAANPGQIASGGHYTAHRHPLIWDVIEESPSFTDKQRLRVVNAFLQHMRSREALGAPAIKARAKAKNPKRMMDRHAMMAAICGLGDVRYLQTHYPGQEFADGLALLDKYFARQMTHGKGWKDEIDLHTYLEMPLRYAIFRRNETFAERGALRLFADRCVQYCNNLGGPGSYPFYLLRMVGHLLQDPGYVYVADMFHRSEQRYGPSKVVHEFLQGQAFAGDLKPTPPERHIGVFVTPIDPIEHWVYDYKLPLRKGFDKLTMRAGFDLNDDYVLLDGISRVDGKANYDAMGITEYFARGRQLIATLNACTITERNGFAHHNLVTVTRDGQAELPPLVGELIHTAQIGGGGYAHVRMDPYICSAYDRRLIWKPNRWLLVCDRMTAKEPGDYAFECHWQFVGEGQRDGRLYRSTVTCGDSAVTCHVKCAQRYPLRVTPSVLDFDIGGGWGQDEYLGNLQRVRQVACAQLEKGQSREFTNLIYASGKECPKSFDVRAMQPGLDVLTGDESALIVSATELDYPEAQLKVEADAAFLSDSHVVLFACKEFAWRALKFESTHPVDVAWSLADGKAEIDAKKDVALTVAAAANVTVDGKAVTQEPANGLLAIRLGKGRHHIAGLRASALATHRQDMANAAAHAESTPAEGETAAPVLEALWQAELPVPVTALAVAADLGGLLVFAGDREGNVHALRNGKEEWTFGTAGKVVCMAVGKLDGPEPALLVGSDDQHLYRLDLRGREVWRCKMAGSHTCAYWTLDRKSKVRAILIDDLDADGKGEIIVGHGGMQLELIDAAGKSLWHRLWHHGIPTTLAARDKDGDGVKEIMAGGWIRSCTSSVKSFSATGKPLRSLYSQGRPSRGFDCAGVPFLSYFREGENLRAVVARSGPYCDLGMYDHSSQKLLWQRVVGDTVSGLALMDLDSDGAPEILYSTQAGWVVALDRAGRNLWARQLTDAVLALAQSGDLIAAACEDGRLYFLNNDGNQTRIAHTEPGRILLAPAEINGQPAMIAASGRRVVVFQPVIIHTNTRE